MSAYGAGIEMRQGADDLIQSECPGAALPAEPEGSGENFLMSRHGRERRYLIIYT